MSDLNIEYNEHKNKFINSTVNFQFIFQVTKCCEYSEWVSVYKKQTTSDLYKNIGFQFAGLSPLTLYGKNKDDKKIILPNDDTIISDFLLQYPTFFIPIYPIPYQVIYRIYYDDGHNHEHPYHEHNHTLSSKN